MCIKCELLNIINKEAEIKRQRTLLSKENYLTTGLLSEPRIMTQESKKDILSPLFLYET